MKKSSREKLIDNAESFAAGCSRSRLELRLVDEIRKVEKELADVRANVYAEATRTEVWYRAVLTKNWENRHEGDVWSSSWNLGTVLGESDGAPVKIEKKHIYTIEGQWGPERA